MLSNFRKDYVIESVLKGDGYFTNQIKLHKTKKGKKDDYKI